MASAPDVLCQKCRRVLPQGESAYLLKRRSEIVCARCYAAACPPCPYCGSPLPKVPKAKTLCKACGKHIFVRSKQALFPTAILTKEQANALDALRRMENYGVGDSDYWRHHTALTKRFAREAGPGDVVWSIFNELLQRSNYPSDHSTIYFNMGLFLLWEGRDPFRCLQQAATAELHSFQQSGVVGRVEIIGGGCPSCAKLQGKKLTIKDALRTMPIPCPDCKFRFNENDKCPWCRCTYVAVLD